MSWIFRLAPIAAAVVLGGMFLVILTELLPPSLSRLTHTLKIILPVIALMATLRAFASHRNFKDVALGAGLGSFALIFWAVFAEITRLSGFQAETGQSLSSLLRFFDPYALGGIVIAFMFALWFFKQAKTGSGRNAKGRSKPKRSKKAVFGDADWLSMKEAAKLFPEGPGIVIGERYRPDLDDAAGARFIPSDKSTWGKGGSSPLLCYNADFGSTHGLVFAGSGGFKTTGIVVPTALNWPSSMVVLDPSREVGPMVARHRDMTYNKEAVYLDPSRPTSGFNVLSWIEGTESPEENISAAASWLIAEKPGSSSGNDDFFRNSSLQLITGVLAHIVLSRAVPAEKKNLRYLREILASPEPKLKSFLTEIHNESPSDFVRETIGPFINMTESTFSGVYASASKDTQWLSFERYAQLVSGDDFSTAQLLSGKIDIYINIDLKALRTHPGLGRVIVGALLNTLYEADGKQRDRVLFMLDEAATLGHMEIVKTARDAGRKYGISMMLVYQSLGQLRDAWGVNAESSWYESTSYRIFAAINDQKTAESLSKMSGDYTIQVTTKSRSSNSQVRFSGQGSSRNRSTSVQDQRRALLMPHEVLADLRTDEQLVFITGYPPLRTGRAIYFRRPDMVKAVDENRFNK